MAKITGLKRIINKRGSSLGINFPADIIRLFALTAGKEVIINADTVAGEIIIKVEAKNEIN